MRRLYFHKQSWGRSEGGRLWRLLHFTFLWSFDFYFFFQSLSFTFTFTFIMMREITTFEETKNSQREKTHFDERKKSFWKLFGMKPLNMAMGYKKLNRNYSSLIYLSFSKLSTTPSGASLFSWSIFKAVCFSQPSRDWICCCVVSHFPR